MTYSAPSWRRHSAAQRGGDVIEKANQPTPLLCCQEVRVRFGGIVALDGVSFDVGKGQIVAIIGPNGAGKTTLFNCISRLYPFDGGDILLEGRSVRDLPSHRMAALGIARTFQNVALFDSLSVAENITLGAHASLGGGFFAHALRLPRAARAERKLAAEVAEIVTLLDLDQVVHRRVGELPFGTRKRVELGRALAGKPRLLLLDEPAAGLNHTEVDELTSMIAHIAERFALSVLLVEHHMNVVMRISHRVLVLDFGRKIGDGTPQEVKSDPQVIRAYLGDPS
ncbi:MAG TPA: ABC transporter ATP-binding protein [Polyangiaceae bacterium]|nr:ABC transporter ATP-binding protein [Polyangiaceae bacterium]